MDAAQHDYDGPGHDAPGMVMLRTIGYYFKLDREGMHLATDWDPETKTVRCTNIVPRVQIVAIRKLKGGAN